MKDGLGAAAVDRIARSLQCTWAEFDSEAFTSAALDGIDTLELKQRVRHLTQSLHLVLPKDFVQAAEILSRVPQHWDFGDPDDPVRGFAAWPIIDYAADYGLDYPEISLELLKNLTHLFSAEFAIRPFIQRYPDHCFAKFDLWVEDDSQHIRRLVSEGSRPRLPWGMRLQEFCTDPAPLLPLLERLNCDPSDYVRRSVANSINDISKDNADTAINLCQNWITNASSETRWIVRHAMRSLIKQGRSDVFPLLGFSARPKLAISRLKLNSRQINLGDSLEFSTQIESKAETTQRLAIDYAIHHCKSNGSLSPKVFKWKEVSLEAGQLVEIKKNHPIRKITTRTYYPGTHRLELLVNGRSQGMEDFELFLQG